MRRLRIALATFVVALASAAPVAAHIIVVTPPGGGNGTSHWIGGGPLPAQAQGNGLFVNPIGEILPPSHLNGLPHACIMLMDNSAAVVFLAPPFFTGCHHGQP
jgi:hypothetical protein